MIPEPLTPHDWLQACAAMAVITSIGQWAYNAVLRPILATIFHWRDLDEDEIIPPLYWLCASGFVALIGWGLFAAHAAGFY